jgi:uncharacterized HAD superfamily protein
MDTIVFDLDGVIATGTTDEVYSDEAGWAFEKCELVEGTKEGLKKLSKDYNLILSTARWRTDLEKTVKWLREKNVYHYFDEIRVGEKSSALLYVDDNGYRFRINDGQEKAWKKLIEDIEKIKEGEEIW